MPDVSKTAAQEIVRSLKDSEQALDSDLRLLRRVREDLEGALKRAREDDAKIRQILDEAWSKLVSCGLGQEIMLELQAKALPVSDKRPYSGRWTLAQTIVALSQLLGKSRAT